MVKDPAWSQDDHPAGHGPSRLKKALSSPQIENLRNLGGLAALE
jgi:hypothetical protein